MMCRFLHGVILFVVVVCGLMYPIGPHAASTGSSAPNSPGGATIPQLPQIQLTPQYLMNEISALKEQMQALQYQVQSLQSTLSAMSSQHGNRLAKLESTLAVDSSGNVTLSSSGKIKLHASAIEGTAATVTVTAGVAGFHGILKADSVVSKQMISASYSPGAGNIW